MKVYIATLPNGFFGSAGCSWQSLDVDKLSALLDYDVEIITINDLMNIEFDPDDTVIYTSSDEENIRLYLRDVMHFINKKCRILPNYNMLLAHENKGFQELFRTELGFGNLRGNYFFDIDDSKLTIPKVLKTISGAGGSGEYLAKNKSDISTIKNKYFEVSSKRKIIKLQRRIKLKSSEFSIYSYRHKGFSLFVEQEFVPNLSNDFKVLVFGDRYYGLKRTVGKNEFRASGSSLFECVKPPKEVLDFARSVVDKIDNPYVSLDIAQSDDGCYLIEFQGTNFSPLALLKCSSRYVYFNNKWVEEENNKDLEENFAYALNTFLSYN
ncbi:hypothetical protein [Psychrobacter sp. S1-30-MNA-CIBAN-0213]|uniref:ATP-grasp domain-containing protein n=1 Tax=Psychrobacter sp. S1-30-MNA-CIBAN-0213 TaxID=3140456 RepID=UPI003327D7D4